MMFLKTFQKNIRIYIALSGISLSIIGIVTWFVLPYIVNKVIDWNVLLYENSDQFQRWKILPQPMEFKVFIFNVTNSDEIHKGALPIVKEIGPYIYNQYRVKEVEDISKDKTTITYTSKQIYKFDSKRSYPLKEDDKIIVLNVAMNVVCQLKKVELNRIVGNLMSFINNSAEELPVITTIKHFIEIISGDRKAILQIAEEIIRSQLGFVNTNIFRMFQNEKSLFITTTPRSFFFDGIPFCITSDTIARFICRIIKDVVQQRKIKAISEMKDGSFEFAFFRYKNNSHDGQYKIYSGINDPSLTTKILTWDGRPHLTMWNNETKSISSCNLIGQSTDGVLFSPHVKPEGSIFAFSTDICRTVELFYQKPVVYEGINGIRFVTGDNFLNKVGSKYSTKCFCSTNLGEIPKYSDGCLYKGVMDISMCQGAPIILSLPHMLDAAKEYQTVKGLKPNLEQHQTFVDLEPNTGYPLRGYKRAQFNMFVRKVDKIDFTQGLKTFLMPIIWVEEGAQLNDQMIRLLNNKMITPLFIAYILIYLLICSGIVIFVGISLWQIWHYCTRRNYHVKFIVSPAIKEID